jgi:hypothetical protein
MNRQRVAWAVIVGVAVCTVAVLWSAGTASAAEPTRALTLPIKEVTVFKDGHAFVLHEGKAATDARGDVVLDYLPAPVLGTFWPYAADPKVKLTGVTAGRRRATISRTALTFPELLDGNAGAKVRLRIVANAGDKEAAVSDFCEGTIVGIPTRSSEELARTSPPGAEEKLPEKSALVVIKTTDGVRAIPIARIEEVTFLEGVAPAAAAEEFRNSLTLRLDWAGRAPPKEADVGMVYVQRGIRWIPEYRVDLDGKGKAHIRLQATLINELADLADVKANLVVGVPTFAFKETLDPMALQATAARLSSYFQQEARTAYAFSNAIMSQSARMGEVRRGGGGAEEGGEGAPVDLGPDVGDTRRNEDLFVFTVDHITLRRGERMVVPVVEYDLAYQDVYRLDLPFAPPPEARQQFDSRQQLELARLMAVPRVMHNVRFVNQGKFPLTTAPALILRDGRPLAQGMMKYTAVGATGDLEVTAAVDIAVDQRDKETGRISNAAKWHSKTFDRIDLAGNIHLVSHKTGPVQIEVTRHILGIADTAGQDGRTVQTTAAEGAWCAGDLLPVWWSWYGWPGWWYEFNGIGRITWNVTLEPGKAIDLEYTWHYLWG